MHKKNKNMYWLIFTFVVFKLYNITKFLQKLARILKMVYNYIRIVVIEMKKIIITLLMVFIMLLQVRCVYAGTIDPNYYNPESERNVLNEVSLDNKAKIIVSVIRGIGIVVSVVSLMIIGIREVTASAEEKSIIKQAMPGYILGAIMVFVITMIPTLIYNFSQGLK